MERDVVFARVEGWRVGVLPCSGLTLLTCKSTASGRNPAPQSAIMSLRAKLGNLSLSTAKDANHAKTPPRMSFPRKRESTPFLNRR
jgi:hypothetical protein